MSFWKQSSLCWLFFFCFFFGFIYHRFVYWRWIMLKMHGTKWEHHAPTITSKKKKGRNIDDTLKLNEKSSFILHHLECLCHAKITIHAFSFLSLGFEYTLHLLQWRNHILAYEVRARLKCTASDYDFTSMCTWHTLIHQARKMAKTKTYLCTSYTYSSNASK